MKSLTEKEKDLIEAIRNFRASKGRMENPEEFEWVILYYVYSLMYDEI